MKSSDKWKLFPLLQPLWGPNPLYVIREGTTVALRRLMRNGFDNPTQFRNDIVSKSKHLWKYSPDIKCDEVTDSWYNSTNTLGIFLVYLVEDTSPSTTMGWTFSIVSPTFTHSSVRRAAEQRKVIYKAVREKLCLPSLPGSSVHPSASLTPGLRALSSRSPGAPSESSSPVLRLPPLDTPTQSVSREGGEDKKKEGGKSRRSLDGQRK